MKLSAHPLWLVGFRPFFCLACLSGLSLPIIWALLFAGLITAPASSFSSTQWHAHEMFFGFGWAVLGGFLLTSTKNWVNKRGFHGNALIFLVAAWLIERFGMWFEGALPPLLFRISNNLFLGSIVGMLIWTLLRHRKDDSYRDNYFFFIILPLFLLAKSLMLSPEYFQIGSSMTLGLFRMAFLVMLERTLNTFMKGAFQVTILTNPKLNKAIKLLGLVLVFESLMPQQAANGIALLLASLLIGRFFFWKPHLALQRLDVGIMYLGYLAIVAQLLIGILSPLMHPAWVGSVSVHVFTFGVMGLIVPAMLIRISNGHTGRKVAFDTYDKTVLRIMIFGFVVRVIAPQLYPEGYLHCIALASACWFACFAMLAWRYIPYLVKARVDGKEH
jgi:uncharacterized protein involved in response to NO